MSAAVVAWPVAQRSSASHLTGRRHSSGGAVLRTPRPPPNQQVHGGFHQRRLSGLGRLPPSRWRAPCSSPSPRPSAASLAATHPPTRAAFSTADIRRALRVMAAARHDTAPLLAQPRRELSPVRRSRSTAKFKSGDSDHQQSGKNDLRAAKGNRFGVGSREPAEARVVAAKAILEKRPFTRNTITRGDRAVRLGVRCNQIETSELKVNQKTERHPLPAERFESIDDANRNKESHKSGQLQTEASFPYANLQGQRTVERVPRSKQDQPLKRETNKLNCSGLVERTADEAATQAEVMTTESFVATEAPSQISSAKLESEELRQQAQQFNLALQQHSVRPIGLGCSGSARTLSSASLSASSSGGQDEAASQTDNHQDRERKIHAESNRDEASNMNQVAERYTIISASSVLSLSDNSAGQQYERGRGDGVSGSSGALNQRALGKGLIGKFVGKKASRLKELVLQNLGRADRTTDELFDVNEMNFYKQHQHVQQLMREFKLYTVALKNYHEASRGLNKCVQQSTSQYQLARHDLACDHLSQLEQLNEDLVEKLHEKVVKSLGEYLDRFEEIKEKINKRHRKLIDYDSSRRLYELMYARVSKKRSLNAQQQQPQQQNYQSILRGLKFLSQQQQQQPVGGLHSSRQESVIASQLVDEARLLKLREQFNYCKLMYETINGELHEEMPIVYELKMKSLLSALQNYYDVKSHYHSNASKLIAKVNDALVIVGPRPTNEEVNTILSMYEAADDKLPAGRRELNGAGSGSSGVSLSGSASRSSGSSLASPDCDGQQRDRSNRNEDDGDDYEDGADHLPQESGRSNDTAASGNTQPSREQATSSVDDIDLETRDTKPEEEQQVASSSTNNENDNHDVEEGPSAADFPASETNQPDASSEQKDYLYRVRTNYKYLAEDVDELCFEANEIIRVIEFDENHEPEDGWLLGIREVNNQRGLFPANFTQPI